MTQLALRNALTSQVENRFAIVILILLEEIALFAPKASSEMRKDSARKKVCALKQVEVRIAMAMECASKSAIEQFVIVMKASPMMDLNSVLDVQTLS